MKSIVFSYDLDKDINNYLNAIYKFKWLKHGRKKTNNWVARFLFPEQENEIRESKSENEAKEKIRQILEKLNERNQKEFSYIETSLEKAWRLKEECFLRLLKNFYQKPIYFSKVSAYFTTLPICPYSLKENWFMVSYRFPLEEQINTICHELMHFMFLHYYQDFALNKLKSGTKLEVLKEALTVFLNTNFREIISIPDRGYPQETSLRNFILQFQENKKTNNFHTLLEEGIKFLDK